MKASYKLDTIPTAVNLNVHAEGAEVEQVRGVLIEKLKQVTKALRSTKAKKEVIPQRSLPSSANVTTTVNEVPEEKIIALSDELGVDESIAEDLLLGKITLPKYGIVGCNGVEDCKDADGLMKKLQEIVDEVMDLADPEYLREDLEQEVPLIIRNGKKVSLSVEVKPARALLKLK